MKTPSAVLKALADLYSESRAGRTGEWKNEFQPTLTDLLRKAECEEGDRRELAERDLRAAEKADLIAIDPVHPRDPQSIHKVRFSPAKEAALFEYLGWSSPTNDRAAWERLFIDAAKWTVPPEYSATWLALCHRRGTQARAGKGWKPFQRQNRLRARAQLEIVSKLLGWKQRCLLRTASAQLSGSSKFLERCLATLESLLIEASGGLVQSLADLQIESNPTAVRFHGPIRLHFGSTTTNYEGLAGESALSENDIAAADSIKTGSPRCVTIENATTFYELCNLGCADLLILTSYPNQATVDFLRRLPAELPLFHFGDTDPWGFDVLFHLRQKSGRSIEPLHMRFGNWAEALPQETRARRQLTYRDQRKLDALLKEPCLADVWEELRRIRAIGSTGDYEQEGLLPLSGVFPYVDNVKPNS